MGIESGSKLLATHERIWFTALLPFIIAVVAITNLNLDFSC